jgi:hypothetical protein
MLVLLLRVMEETRDQDQERKAETACRGGLKAQGSKSQGISVIEKVL